jgi:hypothetical protein
MSATVDVWGWRARFRLARGQTIKDVVAKISEIESGLGHSGVRFGFTRLLMIWRTAAKYVYWT